MRSTGPPSASPRGAAPRRPGRDSDRCSSRLSESRCAARGRTRLSRQYNAMSKSWRGPKHLGDLWRPQGRQHSAISLCACPDVTHATAAHVTHAMFRMMKSIPMRDQTVRRSCCTGTRNARLYMYIYTVHGRTNPLAPCSILQHATSMGRSFGRRRWRLRQHFGSITCGIHNDGAA